MSGHTASIHTKLSSTNPNARKAIADPRFRRYVAIPATDIE